MMPAFLDISLYQVAGANGTAMTIPAGSAPPDFAVAKARGVHGIIARACNDVRSDPSYPLFIPAARNAGMETGAYTYIRPPRGSALLHADRLLAQMEAAGGTSLPPMVDMENFDGQADWAGNRYVDWVLELADLLRNRLGRRPLGYGGRWFLEPMTAPRQAEVVNAHESIIVPAYPHQPGTWPQEQWPRPPVETGQWETWARTTQGGDPGLPNGPTLPTGVTKLDAWQFSSMGDTRNYGWTSAHHLDLNVVTVEAWARWKPEVPVETMYPIGYGVELVTEAEMRRRHEPHMEPEYARRLFDWLRSKGGHIGCGSGRRLTQPTKPGFAPPGKSFHQDQRYADGTHWYTAVDLVARNPGGLHRAPAWPEVPRQGGAEAKRWGVHCNVNGEPWHIQPIEIDGYDSWVIAGRKRPVPGYPASSPAPPIPPPTGDDVEKICVRAADGMPWVTDFASYATQITEEQAARGRDMRGYSVAPDGGPWPLDQQDSDLLARLDR
jgi:GH25 family lysozyme M1 (1,4-beta-N-acetylmuramidase)